MQNFLLNITRVNINYFEHFMCYIYVTLFAKELMLFIILNLLYICIYRVAISRDFQVKYQYFVIVNFSLFSHTVKQGDILCKKARLFTLKKSLISGHPMYINV